MGRSPPLFARLREISNNLKLVDSTPTCIELSQQRNLLCEGPVSAEPEDFEPKTPSFEPGKEDERLCLNTPQEVSKMCYRESKNSLQEYLRFVNSASKTYAPFSSSGKLTYHPSLVLCRGGAKGIEGNWREKSYLDTRTW